MQPLHSSVIFVYIGGAPWRSHGAGRRTAGQLWLSDGLCVRACVWAPWGRGFNPCCQHVFPRDLSYPIFTARSFTKSNRDTHLLCYGNLAKHIRYWLHEAQDQMLATSIQKIILPILALIQDVGAMSNHSHQYNNLHNNPMLHVFSDLTARGHTYVCYVSAVGGTVKFQCNTYA